MDHFRDAGRVQLLVVTVPEDLRKQFIGKAGAKRWGQCLREYVGWLKVEAGFKYGYCRSHPTGDDGKRFHPHAHFMWIQDRKHLGKLDDARVKAAWGKIIGVEVDAEKSNAEIGFFPRETQHEKNRWIHWLEYCERPFPGWTWEGCWGRWYGKKPKLEGPKGSDTLCVEWHGEGGGKTYYCPRCEKAIVTRTLQIAESEQVESDFQAGMLEGYSRRRDGRVLGDAHGPGGGVAHVRRVVSDLRGLGVSEGVI